MATGTVNPAAYLRGPGILYSAPLTTALPSMTVAASKFPATAWAGSWVALGSTDDGTDFQHSVSTDNVEAAESFEPVQIVTTGREASISFSLNEINKANLKLALNGPTPVTTGTGVTTYTILAPPAVGAEVRTMVGWQSEDDTVRFIGYQSLQIGDIGFSAKKGTTKSLLACQFKFELPTAGGNPWELHLAGATRG